MKIAYLFEQGRSDRLEGEAHKEFPSEFFYGAIELRERGYTVDIVEIDRTQGYSFLATLLNIADRKEFLPWRVCGELWVALFRNRHRFMDYDVVVASHSGIGFSLALQSLFKRRGPGLITIQCGLLNHTSGMIRKFLQNQGFLKMQSVLFAESERPGLVSQYPKVSDRIHANPFGVDTTFWSPGATSGEPFVLSVGNDVGRDFETLCLAGTSLTVPIRILTSRALPENMPDHIKKINGTWHRGGVTDLELRELYRNASCVVIPLKEGVQPSGQSVCLQAMACGCPVIMTKTEGFWDHNHLLDGENITLVPVGDEKKMKQAIEEMLSGKVNVSERSRRSRDYVKTYGSIEAYSTNMEKYIHYVASGEVAV